MENETADSEMIYVSWMADVHYAILEHMGIHDDAQHGYTTTANVMAENMEYVRSYVRDESAYLSDRGLLESPKRGKYALSDLGRRFVAGDVTRRELEGDE